jgi:hypothetical protein
LCNPNFHFRVLKSPLLMPAPIQFNPVLFVVACSFKIYFNIIPPCMEFYFATPTFYALCIKQLRKLLKQNKYRKIFYVGFPRRMNINSYGEKSGGTEENPHKSHTMRFNVLVVVLLKIHVFWDIPFRIKLPIHTVSYSRRLNLQTRTLLPLSFDVWLRRTVPWWHYYVRSPCYGDILTVVPDTTMTSLSENPLLWWYRLTHLGALSHDDSTTLEAAVMMVYSLRCTMPWWQHYIRRLCCDDTLTELCFLSFFS